MTPAVLAIPEKFGTVSNEPQPLTKYCWSMLRSREVARYRARPAANCQVIKMVTKTIMSGRINCIACIMLSFVSTMAFGWAIRICTKVTIPVRIGRA